MSTDIVSPAARSRNLARAAMHDQRADDFCVAARQASCPPSQYSALMLAAMEARRWATAIRGELNTEVAA